MPTEITDLDPIVPDDIDFKYKGKSYVLPGDISTRTTFKFQKLLIRLEEQELATISAKGSKAQLAAVDAQEKTTLEIEELLVDLLRERDPEIEELPFGAIGFKFVLANVLSRLGFGEAVVEADPTKPETGKPKPNKSRRSNSSPSS